MTGKPSESRRKMSKVPTPESLSNLEDAFAQSKFNDQAVHMPKEFEKALERLTNLWSDNNVEFRPIDQQCWLSPGDQNKELARFWVRCRSKFDSDSKQAALGFLSGLCSEAMPGQNKAPASQQTLWFNQVDFQPNEWIYCELSALQQFRQCGNFLMCKFWDRSGEILASAVQEVDLAPRAKF
jgi:acyl-CoA thioesterase